MENVLLHNHGVFCFAVFIVLLLTFFQEFYNCDRPLPKHSFIEHYEKLNYPPLIFEKSPKRVRRSVNSLSPDLVTLTLFAFGKSFRLNLNSDDRIVHADAKLIIGGREWPGGLRSVTQHAVYGSVEGYPESVVFGSIINGIFRGTISLNGSEFVFSHGQQNSTFYIEPSEFHFDEETSFHSIIYLSNDVTIHEAPSKSGRRVRRSTSSEHTPRLCGLSDPVIARRIKELSQPAFTVESSESHRSRRSVKNVDFQKNYISIHEDNRIHSSPSAFYSYLSDTGTGKNGYYKVSGPSTRVCNLYLQSDTFLWDHVIKMSHVKGSREKAVQEITSIFTQHVQAVQVIYQLSVFRDHAGRLDFPGVGFRVDRVRINVTDEDCKIRPVRHLNQSKQSPTPTAMPHERNTDSLFFSSKSNDEFHPHYIYADENPFCAPNIDVTNYLNLHSYNKYDDFCLAYIFTYRDFSRGTLGLAWVAELGRSGGVCEKHKRILEDKHSVYKSLNTGVVTITNYGTQVASKVSQLTFAHELGHNFGAKHDDDHKDEEYECLPDVDDPKGNYLMFASATSGDKENNNKFSNCSLDSIARLLDRVLSQKETNCFLKSDGPFCGNQLVEQGEQCDCGFTRSSCRDNCCFPKESSFPCQLKKKIFDDNVEFDVKCSPTAGVCCTKNCQYRNQSHLCRSSGECHRASYCLGDRPECPDVDMLPDGTPCQDHTRVCKQGQCLGSICERIPGWHECSLTRDEKITPELMCFVACKENRTGSPCISTFQLESDLSLRNKYPQLKSVLLKNGKGIKLPPGAPCDNYRGFCDVFLRCNLVDAEGPLSRLRNLLFSPQVLQKVKIWITIHWWAVILIILGSIILMIVFIKTCSVNTPVVLPREYELTRPVPIHNFPPGGGQSAMLNVANRPVAWTERTDIPKIRQRKSFWAWSRSKSKAQGAKIHSESYFDRSRHLVPSAFVNPMDFPPPNARQTPLPPLKPPSETRVMITSELSHTNSNPLCNGSSGSASNSEPLDISSQNRNIKFLKQQNFYQRSTKTPSSNPRTTSLYVPEGVEMTHVQRIHRPKLPTKLNAMKSKSQQRPVSEFISPTDAALCSSPSTSSRNLTERVQTTHSNEPLGSKRIKSHPLESNSLGVPPPAYKDLVKYTPKHKKK